MAYLRSLSTHSLKPGMAAEDTACSVGGTGECACMCETVHRIAIVINVGRTRARIQLHSQVHALNIILKFTDH